MSNFDQGVGSVFYPGIKQIVSANYSRSHGITPDVCQIEMAPQTLDASDPDYTPIEPDGYLLFQFDEYTAVTNVSPTQYNRTGRTQILLQGCRPDKASVRRSATSHTWTIPVYDRRWKWKFGSFSGHWNVKKNGEIEPRKKKTPRELADMCLEAMGEKNYDTRDLLDLEKKQSLPYRNQIFPEVHWDRIPPAQALSSLVTPLGYRVCLGWDDRVRIRKYGEGALLPTEDLMSGGFEANLPETPDSVTVLGGITMHEAIWDLEAVGLDIDGEWRPIDHLSYAPIDDRGEPNWTLPVPGVFDMIKAPLDEIESMKTNGVPVDKDEYLKRRDQYSLAMQTVYRCYRLKYPTIQTASGDDPGLRKKYDDLGYQMGLIVDLGHRSGEKVYDTLQEKYTEARRKLFAASKAVLPGPQQINPRTGKKGDYILEEFEQVLPTFTTRAELGIDSYSGKLIRKPVEVTGNYFDEVKEGDNGTIETRIEGDKFEVVPELGIIRFSEPIYQYKKEFVEIDGKKSEEKQDVPHPADLFARIATPLKNTVGEPARYEHREELKAKYRTKPAPLPSGLKDNPRKIPGGTDTKVVIKNEIVLAYQAVYEPSPSYFGGEYFAFKEVISNEEKEHLKEQALAAIDVENLRINSEDSGAGVYAGLKKIELDGAIQQVAISRTTSGGMTTTVSRNSEVNVIVPTFDQRQRDLALKELIKQQEQTVNKTQQPEDK
ncbi:hypothetical protein [Gimesia maris]|uniref:hypothetical protein n=1 Tax=Gimesia maris TaxID=122 RepID=UPI00241DD8C3|nr:hypothetical protein [Gimesia maris]|tara:strand:+ start:163001 stop:165142 length:2142 start_codon:yes stop_codon:yes gene_type:complete